jgi:hypothetical protein
LGAEPSQRALGVRWRTVADDRSGSQFELVDGLGVGLGERRCPLGLAHADALAVPSHVEPAVAVTVGLVAQIRKVDFHGDHPR